MIALRHDIANGPSQYFDLDDRASITLEAESPLFNYQAIPGLKVYRFQLPNSRRNRAILQFAGEITNRNAVRMLSNVHLEVMGLHFNQGTLNIEGSTAGSTVDAGPRVDAARWPPSGGVGRTAPSKRSSSSSRAWLYSVCPVWMKICFSPSFLPYFRYRRSPSTHPGLVPGSGPLKNADSSPFRPIVPCFLGNI